MGIHLRRHVALAALAGLAAVSGASAATSPGDQLSSMLAAARAETSVHYTLSTTGTGRVGVSFVADAGLAIGVQRITYRLDKRSGHVTVIATADTAYVRGDAFTLQNYLQFSKAASAKYANRWILIPKTASGFGNVAAGVRLPSTIEELELSGPLSIAPESTMAGQRVSGVSGNASPAGQPAVMATVYARPTGSRLPVAQVSTQGGIKSTVLFSNWSDEIHIKVPAGATPVSVVLKTR